MHKHHTCVIAFQNNFVVRRVELHGVVFKGRLFGCDFRSI
jgi:hypothetical protein